MYESETFDFESIKRHLLSIRNDQNNAIFTISIEDLPEHDFDRLEIERIQEIAWTITSAFPNIEPGFLEVLKKMYQVFNHVHPDNGLQNNDFLITGE